eukprot:Gb_08875 [translate_table: standard]
MILVASKGSLTSFFNKIENEKQNPSKNSREECNASTSYDVLKTFPYLFGQLIVVSQGLLKILVNCEKARNLLPSLTLKGHLRSSGTPISRAHLLLGPTVAAPKSSVESSESVEEEDSPSEDCGILACKRGTSQKQKPLPQTLVISLAKYSKKSSRLQKKSAKKVKIMDYVISSEEEKIEKEDVNPKDLRRKEKDSVPVEENKDTTKVLLENQNILKELRSLLKILNRLGGSMTGTYACINLLSLKITNYLKEVVSCLKELNSGRPLQSRNFDVSVGSLDSFSVSELLKFPIL